MLVERGPVLRASGGGRELLLFNDLLLCAVPAGERLRAAWHVSLANECALEFRRCGDGSRKFAHALDVRIDEARWVFVGLGLGLCMVVCGCVLRL